MTNHSLLISCKYMYKYDINSRLKGASYKHPPKVPQGTASSMHFMTITWLCGLCIATKYLHCKVFAMSFSFRGIHNSAKAMRFAAMVITSSHSTA